ncbi:MauE/DoxX family redox-associated membrane protein [Pimelobacter simplex]|uniref:MauE/DoxX family redox-associated membrane protein n=1 Tax=Nocardioides simplex TaxID=2045 RepID=UPI0021506021|nr:MauE/DoxX family redox-associated membrane protein [Pimelobacter simplex]UUW92644.1 hypothetical protein M0M43_14510 [Pimelobacter simplex]UUW96471.1 hypothetical protein M0M48_03140 [Pimelobacter simplex]
MVTVVVCATVVAAGVLLTVAGTAHIRDRKTLLAHLLAHDVLGYRWSRRAAQLLGPVELLLGIVLLLSPGAVLVSGHPLPLVVAAASAAALLLVMTGYVLQALRRGGDLFCACFGTEERLGARTLLRVLLLGLAMVTATVRPAFPLAWADLALALVIGAVVAGLLGPAQWAARRTSEAG